MTSKILPFLVILLLFVVTSFSLFRSELFPMHDFVHGARIGEMSRALADFHIPPRWSQHFGFGFGMPLFLFYAPLPYYFGALAYLIGVPLIFSVQWIILLANFLTIVGAYLVGRMLGSRYLGIIFASLYSLAPYRAVNIFIRGAISETWGMMWLPWILLSWLLMVKKQKFAWLIMVIAVSGLLLSHNLTAMIFIPIFLIIVLIHWYWTGKVFSILFQVFLSLVLAVGVSSYYVLPALVESRYTQMSQRILAGYFDFHLHFLYLRQFLSENWGYGGSEWGPNDGFSFFLGYGIIVGLTIVSTCVVITCYKWWANKSINLKERQRVSAIILLLILIGGVVLLTTEKSVLLWEKLPLLSYLQFPWRFLSVLSLLSALVITLGVSLITSSKLRLMCMIMLVILSIIPALKYFQPQEFLQDSQALFYIDGMRIASHMSDILPDYLPKSFMIKSPHLIDSPIFSIDENTQYSVKERKTHRISIIASSSDHSNIVFAVADFPGWRVFVDRKLFDHSVTKEGLIEVDLPSGEHSVELKFTNTPIRSLADFISILSIILITLMVLLELNNKINHKKKL